MRYLVLLLLFISCTTNKPSTHQLTNAAEEVFYYTNFDFINFAPLDKINKPADLPFIKVLADSDGIKRVKVYWESKKRPVKIYNRISFKGFKAYESKSKFLACTTVDTLISLNDQLYEFRNCWSSISKRVNEQTVFIYKKNGTDTVDLEYFNLYNLYKDTTGRLPADTNVVVPNEYKAYSFDKERYAIVQQGDKIHMVCKSRNIGWCKTGYQDQLTYPYSGCLYWSLFADPYWRVLSK
jgi:hypothetical protein